MGRSDIPICPNCGSECDTIYIIDGSYRCENCIDEDSQDAYEWWAQKIQDEKDFYDEMRRGM